MSEVRYCKRCGRKLKSAESKERGYGKVCMEKSCVPIKPLFSLNEKSS